MVSKQNHKICLFGGEMTGMYSSFTKGKNANR